MEIKRKKLTTTILPKTFKQMKILSIYYNLDNKNEIIEQAIQNEIDRLKKGGVVINDELEL